MKNYKVIFKTIVIFMLLITATSCKKDIEGCTDETADNFMYEANIDNGSCNFHGHLVNWFDMETRDSLLSNNVDYVGVSVDGKSVAIYYPVFTVWSSEPSCNTSAIGDWVEMKGIKSKTISVEVKAVDSTGTVVRQWNKGFTVESRNCGMNKITW